jgi:hypothetical protein
MIKSIILGVLQNQKHIRTLTQIWETQQTTHRVPCTLEIKTTMVSFCVRPSTTWAIPQSGQGTSGKLLSSPTGSKLMERLWQLHWPWTLLLTRAPQTNRRSATCARQRGRTSGRRWWISDRGRRGQWLERRGCIFIRQGAFLTMEHLLAMMVSVPSSSGWMPTRGIMEHLLTTMVSLPASPLSAGQATIIFFYIGF